MDYRLLKKKKREKREKWLMNPVPAVRENYSTRIITVINNYVYVHVHVAKNCDFLACSVIIDYNNNTCIITMNVYIHVHVHNVGDYPKKSGTPFSRIRCSSPFKPKGNCK